MAVGDCIVDATMAHVVRDPARFDVILTTNRFGGIPSRFTAELAGSPGLGASLNAGTRHAMTQAGAEFADRIAAFREQPQSSA